MTDAADGIPFLLPALFLFTFYNQQLASPHPQAYDGTLVATYLVS
jgi:hypothetical protein